MNIFGFNEGKNLHLSLGYVFESKKMHVSCEMCDLHEFKTPDANFMKTISYHFAHIFYLVEFFNPIKSTVYED